MLFFSESYQFRYWPPASLVWTNKPHPSYSRHAYIIQPLPVPLPVYIMNTYLALLIDKNNRQSYKIKFSRFLLSKERKSPIFFFLKKKNKDYFSLERKNRYLCAMINQNIYADHHSNLLSSY